MFELRPYRRLNSAAAYNPFREIEDFERRFFNEPFDAFFRSGEFRTDITDEGENFVLEADLPGFDKKDIRLDLSENTLTINAERHFEHEHDDKKDKYLRVERSYGKYIRQFDVSAINTDAIRAKYENGVLRLTMPKKQKTIPETKQLAIDD
ncbi:MAG: Hsp20/alpha crystallin family protein [Oscillospiraceae bacterium]|nr:Hsp20/alpha crystallin family protein [Oscillospiraceae bacterium]